MHTRILQIIAASCLLLIATVCKADQDPDYPVYGGFALGFASADSDCDTHGYNCDGEDVSFKMLVGKQLHQNLAVEVAYYDLGKFKNKSANSTTTATSSGLNLSVLGMIPISDAAFFYGKAGVMAWQADYEAFGASTVESDDDGTDFTYGAGFGWKFGKQYDIRVEYERLYELGNDFVAGGAAIEVFNIGGTIYFD